jgi:ribosomal protein S18 acetylase RimI-like enzyme
VVLPEYIELRRTLWRGGYHTRDFGRDICPAAGPYKNLDVGICQERVLLTPVLLGFRNYKQSMDCESFVGKTQEVIMNNRPHYYLWGLGVDPLHQAKGIGTALMLPLLKKANAQKTPIFLETHAEENVRYYQRHGFTLMCTKKIPRYGLPIWCMLREPG